MESESDVAGSYKNQFNIFNASIQTLKYTIQESSAFKLLFFVYEAIIHFHYANTVVKRSAKSMKERKLVLRASSYCFTCQLGSKAETW